ncbi:hypothetical protein K7W42_12640 [Deinococcus sp. HMF7604]|uniref:hypothetical protein n=1 Tax=Deinococcus betulae TaxID=2873312 RepID=UPI001CCA3C11|nr:hypothetical protein [Deinococcus betulae]MBZ9751710.1 hypothetical protein [Deinococcus betulae]
MGDIASVTFGPVPVKADVWLGPALGAIPFQTYQANLASAQALQVEAPGTVAEVGVLRALGEPWALAQASGLLDWTPQGQRRGAWLTLVVSRGCSVRAWALSAQAPTVEALGALVLNACAKPMVGPLGRPAALLAETPALQAALGPALAGARVQVQVGTLEVAQQALGAVLAEVQG